MQRKNAAITSSAPLAPLARLAQSVRSLPDRRAALLIAGVAVAAALAARLAWPFDGLYGQDAFAYFRFARALWPWLLHGEEIRVDVPDDLATKHIGDGHDETDCRLAGGESD